MSNAGENIPGVTVPNETNSVEQAGDGSDTTIPVPFAFFNASDLVVTQVIGGVETVLTLTTHYTVTRASDGLSGTVTMVTAPAVGTTIVIDRDVPFTQTTAFRTQGPFSPAVHENAFDRSTMQAQQLERRINNTDADLSALETLVDGDGFLALLEEVEANGSFLTEIQGLQTDLATAQTDIDAVEAILPNTARINTTNTFALAQTFSAAIAASAAAGHTITGTATGATANTNDRAALRAALGHISLGGGNPTHVTAFSNYITPSSAPKAWAVVRIIGGGGIGSFGATIHAGFNVASVARTAATIFRLTFASAFTSAEYMPLVQHYVSGSALVVAGYQFTIPQASRVSSTVLDVRLMVGNDNPANFDSMADSGGGANYVDFFISVFGAQ